MWKLRAAMILVVIVGITALVATVRLIPGGNASAADLGRAEPRSTTWALAVVSAGSPLAETSQAEGEYVYVDVVW